MRTLALKLAALGLLAVGGFALAACGSNESAAPETTTSTSSSSTTGTSTSTTTTESTETGTTTTSTASTGTTTETTETTETTRTATGTTTRSGGGGPDLDAVAFRTRGNTVVCGPKGRLLVCFVPTTGATVRLARGGVPKAEVEAENRGVPAEARSAPVLARGVSISVSGYTCTGRKAGVVRCRNAGGHGFELSSESVFRF